MSKNKLSICFTSGGKKQVTGHRSQPQSTQGKTKFNNSMLNIWDSFMILWAFPRGLDHFSCPTLRSIHSHLLGSGQFHLIAIGVSVAIIQHQHLHTARLPHCKWSLCSNVSPVTHWQASTVLHDPLMPFKTNTTWVTLTTFSCQPEVHCL